MKADARSARPARARWLRAGLFGVLAGGAVLAAACGGGRSSPGGGAASSPNISLLLDAYAQCVRSHGVPGFTITHVGSTPPPPSQAQEIFQGWVIPRNPSSSAKAACQHLFPRTTAPDAAEQHQAFLQGLKAAACMRSHGYPNWPDPPANGGVFVPTGIDTSSPQFKAAAKTCGEGPFP
jgi:hypothetical protein